MSFGDVLRRMNDGWSEDAAKCIEGHAMASAANFRLVSISPGGDSMEKMDPRYHRTREGVDILIAEMSDDHLGQTILYHLRQMAKAKAVLDSPESSKFRQVIYGLNEAVNKKEAERTMFNFFTHLPRYLMEALVRGFNMDKFRDDLQALFGRSYQYAPITALLPSDVEPFDPDDDLLDEEEDDDGFEDE